MPEVVETSDANDVEPRLIRWEASNGSIQLPLWPGGGDGAVVESQVQQ